MWLITKLLDSVKDIRIKELERHNETLIGANSILERELEKGQLREKILQERLFEVLGVTNNKPNIQIEHSKSPIQLHSKKSSNWPSIQSNLELKSREAYWNKKKAEEAKNTEGKIANVETLEKEILGENYG